MNPPEHPIALLYSEWLFWFIVDGSRPTTPLRCAQLQNEYLWLPCRGEQQQWLVTNTPWGIAQQTSTICFSFTIRFGSHLSSDLIYLSSPTSGISIHHLWDLNDRVSLLYVSTAVSTFTPHILFIGWKARGKLPLLRRADPRSMAEYGNDTNRWPLNLMGWFSGMEGYKFMCP